MKGTSGFAGVVFGAIAVALTCGCGAQAVQAGAPRPVSREVRDAYETLCDGVESRVPEVRAQAASARANWVLDAAIENALGAERCGAVGPATLYWLHGLKLPTVEAAATQVSSDFVLAGEPEKGTFAGSLLRSLSAGCIAEPAPRAADGVDGWRTEREAAVALARLDWEMLPAAVRAKGRPLLAAVSALRNEVMRRSSSSKVATAARTAMERKAELISSLAVVGAAEFPLTETTLRPPVMLVPVSGASIPADPLRLRTVLIRSTGVDVAVPKVEVACDGPDDLCVAPAAAAFAWPGRTATRFEGEGAISPDAIEGESVPALAATMDEVDSLLRGAPWLSVEQQSSPDGVLEGVSVVADGNLYYGSFQPIVHTLLAGGWSPVVLHALAGRDGALSAAPIRFVEKAPEGTGRILIRTDGYILEAPLGTDAKSEMIPWTAPGSLLRVYRFFDAGRTSEAGGRPWVIQVDDAATDIGILVHLVSAIAYRRQVPGDASRDKSLLEAPLSMRDGLPEPLWPGGFVIEL